MSEEVPALTGRLRTAAVVTTAAVIAAGVFLRFVTHSALWLDEALTVDIARLPLHGIPNALKHDGAPPLFYYLLHFWIALFGNSDLATRSLSGLFGVLTLPVAWCVGRRFGGRAVAWTLVILLASAPFAVYYSTEARMYSLVILLTGCGFLALHRALTKPRVGNLVALAVVTAALLYTQYWALYLAIMVGIWLLVDAGLARRRDPTSPAWRRPAAALLAVAVGGLAFLPWLPIFIFQAKHTGTPWAKPPNFAAVINAITGFTDNQGSTSTAGTNQGRLLALIYFAMVALALFGMGKSDRVVELDLHTRPRARFTTFVVVGTLFAAIAGGILDGSAFAPRYASVVFLPLLLLVAYGTITLLSPRIRVAVIAVAVVAGLVASAQNVDTQRSQSPKVAAVINAQAQPGDLIAFCPDQLGPAVYRVVRHQSAYKMVTFPRGIGPQLVDWVDYEKTVHRGNPVSFAAMLAKRAGTTHRIWLVWQQGYQTYGVKCEQLAAVLGATAGFATRSWVVDLPMIYYEPMSLTEFAPTSPSS
jgi:mannosyltransferase